VTVSTEAAGSYTAEKPSIWQRYGKAVVGIYLLLPALFMLTVFFLIPLVIVFGRSFDVADGESVFANYTSLWDSEAFRKIMRITFEIAVSTTVVCLVLGYLFAYRLSMMPRTRANLFLLISLVPFWTAILARLYSWTIILGRRGVLNDWLGKIGIDPIDDLLFSRKAVIIGMVHVMIPYMIIILYSTMISIDRALLDASRSLGASGFQTFRRVFLPMTMPGVYAGSLLVFIISLGFYITPAVLGGGGDTTISMFISEKTRIGDWGVATAMGAVLLAVTLFLFFIFNKVFGTERLITGAIRK
ncbi:MAG: ABC transporter permease, partial [Dehalococcoidia bacterium]|nr:ABC transporter permease [Dehalococcoidia bacterium]